MRKKNQSLKENVILFAFWLSPALKRSISVMASFLLAENVYGSEEADTDSSRRVRDSLDWRRGTVAKRESVCVLLIPLKTKWNPNLRWN